MLGIVIGLVAAVGIITFLNRDPAAAERYRKEQQ